MSTIKADGIQASTGTNTDLTLAGKGTGVPDLAAGFKVGGTVEKLTGVAPSTSGNVLTSDGTDWTSAAAAGGGAWNLIGTSVASSSASLTITGLDSTYDTYAIAISDFQGATDIQELRLRCGDSGGIDSGSGDYAYHLRELKVITSSTGSGGSSSSASFIKLAQNMGNLSTEGIGGMVYVHCPSDGAVRPIFTGEIYGMDNDGTGVFYVFGGDRTTNITFDRVQIYFAVGNIARGRLTVWGISHA